MRGCHSKDNPYSCKECDKSFTAPHSLKKHKSKKEHAKEINLRLKFERSFETDFFTGIKNGIDDPLV